MRILLVLLVVAAALSLILFDKATYDPTAWLIWGRQIADGTLDTVAGPTWKPLPVVLTTPFSLFGEAPAMSLWLVVSRVAGLLSLVLAYRLAARLAGRTAGVVAVVSLALAAEYGLNWMRGNSEGLLVMFALLSVLRHIEGHHWQAFGCAAAASLLRPDVWPLFALYGLWLLWRDRDLRTAVFVFGGGAAVLAAWLVPEYIGSGDFFRGAKRAQEIVPGSPGASGRPFLDVFTNGAQSLSYGIYAGALLSLAVARTDRRVAAIAAGSALLMAMVALGASGAGFTGSLRYVTLPASLVCVLAGVGWAWLARRVDRRLVVVLALAAVPGLVLSADRVTENVETARVADRRLDALPVFIAHAGGREAVLACAPLYTGAFSTQALAYELDLRQRDVHWTPRPEPPGTILDQTVSSLAGRPGFVRKLRESEWTLQSTC